MSQEIQNTGNLIKGRGQNAVGNLGVKQKVVKNQIVSARTEAARILAEAEETATAVCREAQKEAEKQGTLGSGHYDDIGSMFDDVYETLPWHLAEQRDAARAEAHRGRPK